MTSLVRCCLATALLTIGTQGIVAHEHTLHRFERQRLTGTYYSEGVGQGDLNNDGHPDIVYGPYWYAGPKFEERRELFEAVPQNMEGYANHFFCWTYDFDGDGWRDVLTVGFPGTPAYVYQNPGNDQHGEHWPKHQIFDWVSNESPQWVQLVGDERPELVCTRDGFFGYVTPNWENPFAPWTFHRISEQVAPKRFGHGLGVGDLNSDGRVDVLMKAGWFEQPETLGGRWTFHPVEFAAAGGAEMYAYDVDGDGDNDVITSLQAHDYGLAWYEQQNLEGKRTFKKHLIMGDKLSENPYGVLFTELHSVALADIDGDGLKDICTGKTYYSHHKQSPMWDTGAVVYWFKLERTAEGVNWIPYLADEDAGIGRQLVVADVNSDSIPDMLSGGMKGCHVMIQSREKVDDATFDAAQPQRRRELKSGLLPDEAAKQMTVPPGFRVELAAGEPVVHQPIGFTIDHRGRLWVAEAYNYPLRAPEGQGRDKIIILEDTNQDGTLDSRKEFISGLNLVSGIEVGFGGVWVGAAPYLLFIPDRDGDDRPDGEPQVLLDGFGYQDTHETLNAFIWGPDGWLYGCHGVFTHSRVGTPGTPDEQRVPMNAAVWRYHPTRHEFDVFARGTSNPWGVDFNDHGQAFITACVIPHLWHIVQGARYQRQGGQHFNPYLYDDIKTIADHSHYTGNIRDSAWWGHEPELSDSVSIAGGGHAHCGAMIYLGNNWPSEFRNSIYFNNVHGNRVNNDVLERRGSGYVGHHGADFLMANDKWYRGINLKSGPDGTVHLIDWYDKNACHRTNPDIWDRSNGRIYRVRYGNAKPLQIDLSTLSDFELAKLQQHANEWHVRTSRRLLQERSTSGSLEANAIAELERQASSDLASPQRLRALWTLHATGQLTQSRLDAMFDDTDEYVRAWAVQFAVPEVLPGQMARAVPKHVHSRLLDHSSDKAAIVRLYVASALQRIPLEQRWAVAEQLTAHAEDADDHNLPLMIWYGVEPLVPSDVERAMALAQSCKIPQITKYIVRRASASADSLQQVIAAIPSASSARSHLILDEVLNAFEGRVDVAMPSSWNDAYTHLLKSDDTKLRDKADRIAVILGDKRILPRMRGVLSDNSQPLKRRQQAFDVLVRGRDPQAGAAFIAVLDVPELRGGAIRALAAYQNNAIPNALLSRYAKLPPAEQRDAIGTLTSRPEFVRALLDAIESNVVPRTDVHAYHVRQIQSFNNQEIMERLGRVWGTIREASADKKQVIAEYRQKFTPEVLAEADTSHGRIVFNKTCAACHRLFGHGANIGPDITGSNRANLDYILENLIDPSAVVSQDYRMSTLELEDGRVITGLIEKTTDSAYTVRTVNDVLLIAKSEVEFKTLSPLSLMPEGQLGQLDADAARDLIAYLASPSQVPLPKIDSPIDSETGRVPSAIEGETLKVVGKTGGTATSQGMGSFSADRWSGNSQLWWTGQSVGGKLDLEVSVEAEGRYYLELALTRARDYGVVELFVNGESLGEVDCFIGDRVDNTGLLRFGPVSLESGKHVLSAKIVGKHQKSTGTMFGLDYVRLTPAE